MILMSFTKHRKKFTISNNIFTLPCPSLLAVRTVQTVLERQYNW